MAERAGVGLQTLIRRVQTKDGLVPLVNEWVVPAIGEARGEPDSSDPDAVAAAIARQYERFGALIDRTIRQEEASPALAESAQAGAAAHREWIEAAFADEIARGGPALAGQLVALCGVELWLVAAPRRRPVGRADPRHDRPAAPQRPPLTPERTPPWHGSSPTPRPPPGMSTRSSPACSRCVSAGTTCA